MLPRRKYAGVGDKDRDRVLYVSHFHGLHMLIEWMYSYLFGHSYLVEVKYNQLVGSEPPTVDHAGEQEECVSHACSLFVLRNKGIVCTYIVCAPAPVPD